MTYALAFIAGIWLITKSRYFNGKAISVREVVSVADSQDAAKSKMRRLAAKNGLDIDDIVEIPSSTTVVCRDADGQLLIYSATKSNDTIK